MKPNPHGPTKQNPNWPGTSVSLSPADDTPTENAVIPEQPPASAPVQNSSENQKVKVLAASLSVRREPNKNNNPIYYLSKDEVVEATSFDDGVWISILAEGDRVGYVMKEFTIPVEE